MNAANLAMILGSSSLISCNSALSEHDSESVRHTDAGGSKGREIQQSCRRFCQEGLDIYFLQFDNTEPALAVNHSVI